MEPRTDPPRLAAMAHVRPAARNTRDARSPVIPLLVVLALVAAACSSTGTRAGTSPGAPSAAPSAIPSAAPVGTPEAAVAAIRARAPWFDGIAARDAALIGQAASWQADATGAGTRVTFEIGWGDCQAGCIDRHTWTWDVASDGTVTWVGEDGSTVPAAQLAALRAASTATGVGGRVTGGPTCPVERPNDPSCAPRPVTGAVLVVRDSGETEVARFTTDGSGFYRIALAPGSYTLEAAPADGFMHAPSPQTISVAQGVETALDVAYDTGIR